jgi:hypothetical protein
MPSSGGSWLQLLSWGEEYGRTNSIHLLNSHLFPGSQVSLTSGSASRLQLLSWGEEYILAWPGLQLLAPTSPRCPVVFKGECCCCCCCRLWWWCCWCCCWCCCC